VCAEIFAVALWDDVVLTVDALWLGKEIEHLEMGGVRFFKKLWGGGGGVVTRSWTGTRVDEKSQFGPQSCGMVSLTGLLLSMSPAFASRTWV
jgi:hypothetical protein